MDLARDTTKLQGYAANGVNPVTPDHTRKRAQGDQAEASVVPGTTAGGTGAERSDNQRNRIDASQEC